jgi:hypothetical protein
MHSYAVDSEDGYTHEFLAQDDASAMLKAREAVSRLFAGQRGPFMVWNLEGGQKVGEFS